MSENCKFCHMEEPGGNYEHNGELVRTFSLPDDGSYHDLHMGFDRFAKVGMMASENYYDVYYPKYCPECGRKLREG